MGVGTYLLAAGGGVLIGTPVAIALVVLGSLFMLVAGASTEPAQRRVPYLARVPLVARVAGSREEQSSLPSVAAESIPSSDDPSAFARGYSEWVRAKRAALPDWPGGEARLRGGLSTESPAYQSYNETRHEVQRRARIEYHERFRSGVLAIVGEAHEQAGDPHTIEDLEGIERLLRRADEGTVEPPPSTPQKSLPLQLRGEANRLSTLRGRLNSDYLARTSVNRAEEFRVEMEGILQRVQVMLARGHEGLAHELLAPVPEAALSRFVGGGNETDQLNRELRAYVTRLEHIINRLPHSGADTTQLAREVYRNGVKVRERNVWGEGAPNTQEEFAEAQARAWHRATEWGVETWKLLFEHFPPQVEREFFGDLDKHAMGATGFRLNASAEREAGSTADSYMERKLAILAGLEGEDR
ncbi:MAG: hypothetical protein LC808_23630 [Actinobacteria bacterium]|nr:hypothetical protein [Actinomycetota bacterium]